MILLAYMCVYAKTFFTWSDSVYHSTKTETKNHPIDKQKQEFRIFVYRDDDFSTIHIKSGSAYGSFMCICFCILIHKPFRNWETCAYICEDKSYFSLALVNNFSNRFTYENNYTHMLFKYRTAPTDTTVSEQQIHV